MIKIVTLLKRRPDLTPEEFQRHWRERHGPLAAQGAGLRRYVQSHALLQGYRKGDLLYDGIEEMWFDDNTGRRRFLDDSLQQALHRIAGEFLDETRTVVMPVDVIVAKPGDIPPGAVKNIEFVNRRADLPLAEFRRYWREVHGPLASGIPAIRRYEQNHLSLDVYRDTPSPPYDGLAITWFDSTAEMRRGTTTQVYADTRADEANFLPPGHLPIIITREVEMVTSAG